MSQENVEAFKRGLDAYNRRDTEALLSTLASDVEWYPALLVGLGGQASVYRGHEGVRELLRDTDETLAEIHVEISQIRDLGDQILAVGRLRTRGKASGVLTESDAGFFADYHNGKATCVRTFLDPEGALEAAGLTE
jgi:ketosteroid isomerase-like protein